MGERRTKKNEPFEKVDDNAHSSTLHFTPALRSRSGIIRVIILLQRRTVDCSKEYPRPGNRSVFYPYLWLSR